MSRYGKEIAADLQPHEADEPSRTAAVVASDLTLAHGARVALADASFALPAGRRTALIGPNGSGKSTLLHAIAGLHQPRSGRVEVQGDAEGRRRSVAYVLQHLHANEQLPVSVREVVTMGRYGERGPFGRLRAEDREAVGTALERLDVTRFAKRPLGELSGGERQRVLVAQALAQRAPVLLLDEPVTGLDVVSQERIEQVVADEVAAGTTVVLSTHSLAEAADADHLLLLAGRVVAEGPAAEVLSEQHLRDAYGSMVIQVPGTSADGGIVLVDDGSHHHDHDHSQHLH
jgi:manganese transport system ATP-binding protein